MGNCPKCDAPPPPPRPQYCDIHTSQRLDANGRCPKCDTLPPPPRPQYCNIHKSQRLDANGRCPKCDALPSSEIGPYVAFGAVAAIIALLFWLRRKPEDPSWIPDKTWTSPAGNPDILYSPPLAANDGGNGGISLVCRARISIDGKLKTPHYILKYPRGNADAATRESVMFEAQVLGFLERAGFRNAPVCSGMGQELVRGRNIPWYLMDCASGTSLDKLMASWSGKPFDPYDAGRMLKALCLALVAMHKTGVCHRDIKPRNIFWDGRKVTIIDFGSARIPGAINPCEASIPVTERWAAPEQIAGTGAPIGPMADVFSFGLILCSVVLSIEHLERGEAPQAAYGEAVTAVVGPKVAGIVFGKVLAAEPEARKGALYALEAALKSCW